MMDEFKKQLAVISGQDIGDVNFHSNEEISEVKKRFDSAVARQRGTDESVERHLIQKELENRGIEILSSGFERIPQITKKLSEAEMADVEKLIEKIEEDDDVMNVYHTMEE